MHNKSIVWAPVLIVLALAIMLVPAAWAGNFHFNSIDFGLGGSLVAQGDLAGLGNEAAEVTLTGQGFVTAMCENNGGQQAPGRNPILVSVQQSGVFVSDENGHALVEVIAPDPTSPEFEPSPTPKQAGCPNGNWAVVGIVDGSTAWTGATIIVKDESGQVQIELSFVCTTLFEGGLATDISCVRT